MIYYVIRAIFVLLFTYTGLQLGRSLDPGSNTGDVVGLFLAMFGSVALVALESYFAQQYVAHFFSVVVGILMGLLISVFFIQVIAFLPADYLLTPPKKHLIDFMVVIVCCYFSVVFVVRARGNYRLIIPFVELKQQGPARKRLLLDPSAIIDGRIADVCNTPIIDQTIFLPDFVLAEVHRVADSEEALRRKRGKRGLDVLATLRANPSVKLEVLPTNYPDADLDTRLIKLASDINGRIVTNDYSLNKIAQLQGVEIINLNDIAQALRPLYIPGETLTIKLVRQGEESHQGVGYLEDGTMVVVEHARHLLGSEAGVEVTSVLQRSAGRMIFGRLADTKEPRNDDRSSTRAHAASGPATKSQRKKHYEPDSA